MDVHEIVLFNAVVACDVEQIKNIIESGAVDVNFTINGQNLLHFALLISKSPLTAVFEILIDAGININHQNLESNYGTGTTLMMNAVNYDHVEVIPLLLSRGADPNVTDSYGADVLKYVILSRVMLENAKMEIIELLLNFGAKCDFTYDPSVPESEHNPSILSICSQSMVAYFVNRGLIANEGYDTFPAVYNKCPEVLKYLVANNLFDVRRRLPNGHTVLYEALRNTHSEHVAFLVQFGKYDIDEKFSGGMTLLGKAMQLQTPRPLRLLYMYLRKNDGMDPMGVESVWSGLKEFNGHSFSLAIELIRQLASVTLIRCPKSSEDLCSILKYASVLPDNWQTHLKACEAELQRLQGFLLRKGVTYKDVLMHSNVGRLACSQGEIDLIRSEVCEGNFPYYESMMQERLDAEIAYQEYISTYFVWSGFADLPDNIQQDLHEAA